MPVQGIPQFSISNIKTEPTKVTQGSSVILKINLKNIGEKEGKDTSIKVFEKSDQPFEFKEKTNYIGTLKSGEIGTSVFKFNVEGDAIPTKYLLNIQVRTVYDGKVLVSEETIPISVYGKEGGITNIMTGAVIGANGVEVVLLGLLIPLVLVLLFLIIVLKKSKKRDRKK